MNVCKVGIVVFPDVEVLDFCGPFEVFSATRLDEAKRREESSPYQVRLLAERAEVVVASGGLKVVPDHVLASCPSVDVLLVPGGWGTRRETENETLVRWIAGQARRVGLVASVCTGARLLAKAGALDGKRATTHTNSLGWLRESFPAVTVVDHERVVEDGNLISSAGISAGIDLALRVVARHHGEAVARATARHMEYPYPENNSRVV